MRRSWDDLYIRIAAEMSTMSTCGRRHVGCVLVSKNNRILSTGLNGVPPGWPHCDPASFTQDEYFDRGKRCLLDRETVQCSGIGAPPGLSNSPQEGLLCVANHSESNALLYCSDVSKIRTCYTTTSPCIECVKKLLCTGTSRIVFLEDYPGPAKELWMRYGSQGRKEWLKYGS